MTFNIISIQNMTKIHRERRRKKEDNHRQPTKN